MFRLTTSHRKNNFFLQNVTQDLGFGRIFCLEDLSQGKWMENGCEIWYMDPKRMDLRGIGWGDMDWIHLAQDGG
jgi:hypothetical protein